MIKIMIGSFKGGTAKTVSSLNIAYSISLMNKKVLLIDLDPQGNLTSLLGCFIPERKGISEVFCKKVKLKEVILETKYEGLLLIPASHCLEDYREFNLNITGLKEQTLLESLQEFVNDFDFCILDTPPSLGFINRISFITADFLIPCIGSDPLSILGLQSINDYLCRNNDEFKIEMLGIIISFWEKRIATSKLLERMLQEKFPDLLFKNKIHKDVSINKSIIQEKSVIHVFPNKRVSKDYLLLSKEIVLRATQRTKAKELLYDRL